MQRREFRFTEGSSDKFWSIELQDQGFIVHYGKAGTSGQAQEKTFATAEAAKKEHDKLIAEKTKKGYVEVQAGNASAARPQPIVKQVDGGKKEKPEKSAAAVKGAHVEAAPKSMPAEVAAVSAPDAAAATSLSLERRVRLDERDRAKVSWLWKPLPRPQPRLFDREKCIEEAKKWLLPGGRFTALSIELPQVMTQDEAWFWIQAWEAGLDKSRGNGHWLSWLARKVETVQEWEAILRAETASPLPADFTSHAFAGDLITTACQLHRWLRALAPFFQPAELAARMIDAEIEIPASSRGYPDAISETMQAALADCSLIYESTETREKFRDAMSARYHAEGNPRSAAARLALAFLCTIRGGSELESYLGVVDATSYGHCSLDLRSLTGLRDEDRLVSEVERLHLPLSDPGYYYLDHITDRARLWLAATEWRQLDFITKSLVQSDSRESAIKVARVLALVEAPEAARAMLEVQLNSKAPTVAVEWFAQHPLHTAVGLTPVAMGSGKTAEAAREHLHQLRRRGQTDVLEAALPHLPENESEWLRRQIIEHAEETLEDISAAEMPAALAEALPALKPIKAAPWLQPESLPPIRIAGKKLPLPDVGRILAVLKDAPLASTLRRTAAAEAVTQDGAEAPPAEVSAAPPPPALVQLLKQHADALSLDAFAWRLFEQWLSMGAASKDKWALGAVGHLGGDDSVLKLTPMVRNWPGESQHQRAVFGLEVLRAIATDTALMSLNGIAQKLKFQGLKEKAQIMMEDIAQARGLTREQLADRIVPDCGLDARGGRVFDFGPRQFSFVLGAGMKPLVRDAAGKVKPDLPAPNNSDNADQAAAAVAEWKLLKKTLKEALKVQAERMEDAMITGRRWSPQEFETLLLRHPLMVNLARQLLFGVYDEKGRLGTTFRITEDQSLADAGDDPFDLPGSGLIGVVHPAHLDAAAKSAWGQVFSDYEIIPPFPQLGREICHAEPGDLDLTEITRFRGPKIPGIIVYGILERSCWVKDKPADAGGFMQHSKFFPAANVSAFIHYTGMGIGYYEEPQEIESVYFVPGYVEPEYWGRHANKLLIRNVDPVVLSEVLRLVHAIVAKAA